MKTEELHGMAGEQLDLTLKETIKNLFHLRVQSATERLETPSQLKKARRDIARVKTVQREQQLLQELLGKLPPEEATRIRGMKEPQRRLSAAQAAVKKATKGK